MKSQSRYLLEVSKQLNCVGKDIVNNQLLFSRDHETRTTHVKIGMQSDVMYEKKSLEFEHRKFNKKNGLFHVAVQGPKVDFATKLAYERKTDEVTGALVKGNYVLDTSFGDEATKTCEMNIESNANYYNKLSCKVKTAKLPVQFTYGYSLKVTLKLLNYSDLHTLISNTVCCLQ